MAEEPRTKWVEVSTKLLAELGEWSEPLRVKVVSDTFGVLDMIFQRAGDVVPRARWLSTVVAYRSRLRELGDHTHDPGTDLAVHDLKHEILALLDVEPGDANRDQERKPGRGEAPSGADLEREPDVAPSPGPTLPEHAFLEVQGSPDVCVECGLTRRFHLSA